ncbi:MAG: MYXO-CTERM sorting domain-containing protein [Deltaproteobacteria bacterium]|nr:MYXO-CTERM sorting domain-containing protein [Deltaproteobacteria bacterium]
MRRTTPGGSASADGTGDGGGDTEGDSDPGQDGGEASGCGCTSDAPAGGRVGLLALVAALGLRRRRR